MTRNLPAIYVKRQSLITPAYRKRIKKIEAIWKSITLIAITVLPGIGLAGLSITTFLPDQSSDGKVLMVVSLLLMSTYAIAALEGNPRVSIVAGCPMCKRDIDFNKPWRCGNCGGRANGFKLANTPFSWCANFSCSDKAQSAIQCPHCAHHLITDLDLYEKKRTNEPPHEGAAMFEGDTQRPKVVQRNETGAVPLNDLFRGL